MRKRLNKKINILLLVSVIAPIIILSGCTQQTNNPGANTVAIENLAFKPSTLTVTNGTTVTWINNDNVDHNVIADDNLFNSGTINPGQNYTYTFTTPGTYNYICSLHPGMSGTIIVQ